MIRRLAFAALAFAFAVLACASIDPPAAFVPPEAGSDPSRADSAPFDRCQVLPRTIASDASAKLYAGDAGAEALCVTLEIGGGGTTAVVFCVAGNLANAAVGTPRDLGPDLSSCAYCLDVQTGCVDGGTSASCASYAPITGKARIVRLERDAGGEVWVDVGGLVVARVESRDGGGFFLERRDCLFADGLTFQGIVEPGTCSSPDASTACQIASTAASRVP